MFIGRNRELKTMERLYGSERFEFTVIYGRRRVGKTALINEFCKNKPTIYFTGVESNARQNLENFSRSVLEYAGSFSAGLRFSSFQDALESVFRLAEKERLVLVIDEYPYVAHVVKSLASTLQMLIDRFAAASRLMLILCGSSMSYMEDHVLAYKAPLYGRRTAQLELLPFDFKEVCRWLPNMSGEDRALVYGLVGGTPQYLLQVNDRQSIEENVKRIYLNPSSILYEEPVNLLKQEVREPAIYTAIISAIASGASRMSEISGKVGEDTNVCSTYLKSLENLGIVQKETPYGEKVSRRTIYVLADNMFRFWYRFVLGNVSMIARGADDLVYNRIEPFFSDYMGRVFEDICKQYLWEQRLAGNCPVEFSSLGRWWGTDPAAKSQTEIDIMAEQDKNTALFAECKWTNEKIGLNVLETLVHRSTLFSYTNVHYVLFSKTGFTEGCRAKVNEMGNVTLVSFAEMMDGCKLTATQNIG